MIEITVGIGLAVSIAVIIIITILVASSNQYNVVNSSADVHCFAPEKCALRHTNVCKNCNHNKPINDGCYFKAVNKKCYKKRK